MQHTVEDQRRQVDILLLRMQSTLVAIDKHFEELQELTDLARVITRTDDKKDTDEILGAP